MATYDLIRSLDRLEAALSQAETAAETLSSTRSDTGLARRHERLREEVAHSVEVLDQLLDRRGG